MRKRYKATAQSRGSGVSLKSGNLETIIKEVIDYLHRRPSPITTDKGYNADTIRKLFATLEPFDLTKAELLMILNLRPLDVTALDTLVEEIDDRFTQTQQEEMVGLIKDVLGTGMGGETEDEHQQLNADGYAEEEMQDVEHGADNAP
ncbi:MAG: hypothetical protein M4579_004048 [Chaenotheca gracillima]|nr:MAG: hypothetical protein M4579_004048 [Chaenotheca gracillima]